MIPPERREPQRQCDVDGIVEVSAALDRPHGAPEPEIANPTTFIAINGAARSGLPD
jgi:hypothetical protein